MSSSARRRHIAAIVVMLCVCGALADPAAAQQAQAASRARGDFSMGVWGGYAATKIDCENCEEGASYGERWQLGLFPMWRVNDKLLAGVELVLQPKTDQSRASLLLGTVQFYPWANHGLFLKGGYGLLWVRTRLNVEAGEFEGKFRGMVLSYGAGWHFRQDSRVSFAAFGAHYPVTAGTVQVNDFEAYNVVGNIWVGGLSVVF